MIRNLSKYSRESSGFKCLSSAQYCLAPSSGDDGCTTTLAIHAQIGRRTASTPLQSAVILVGAIPPNTTDSDALRDLAQNVGPPAASWAPCSSRPNDSTAREALPDQTIDSRGRSPESCIDHRGWCECCREPADRAPLDGSRRLKSKSTRHTKRPKNKKPPPKGWLNQRSMNEVKAQ